MRGAVEFGPRTSRVRIFDPSPRRPGLTRKIWAAGLTRKILRAGVGSVWKNSLFANFRFQGISRRVWLILGAGGGQESFDPPFVVAVT